MPAIELDERYFEIIAQSPTAVLTKHRVSGSLTLWRLEWSERGDYPAGFDQSAWAAYLKATQA